MDERSTKQLRETAFAANLRRAYGTAQDRDVPSAFAELLDRLGHVRPSTTRDGPDPRRLDA